MAYSSSFGLFTCIQMCQLQPREALITSQSSTRDVIELIFKGRLSWVYRNFDRDHLYKVMHTFPDLNSIFSLPVVVVVCHRGFVYWLYWKIRMGNWGSGMWDPFLGGRGRVFRLIAKFAVLFLGKKMMPAISMRMLHETSSTLRDLKSSWCFGKHITVTFECTECFVQV